MNLVVVLLSLLSRNLCINISIAPSPCLFCGRNLDFLNDDGEDDFDALVAEMEKEMSIADIMKELGYGCTATVLQCKEMLSLFLPLTEVTVARILGMVVCTGLGIEDNLNVFSTFHAALGSSAATDPSPLSSWNADVLIDAIKQLVSSITLNTTSSYFLIAVIAFDEKENIYAFHLFVCRLLDLTG